MTYLYSLSCSTYLHTLYSPTQLCPVISSINKQDTHIVERRCAQKFNAVAQFEALIWCSFSRNNYLFQPTNIFNSKTFHLCDHMVTLWEAVEACRAFSPHYTGEKTVSGKLSDLSKATQVNGGAGRRTLLPCTMLKKSIEYHKSKP